MTKLADAANKAFEKLKETNRHLNRKVDVLTTALDVSRRMTDELRQTNKELWAANIKLQDYIKNNFVEDDTDATD
jgi:hypothetical protein